MQDLLNTILLGIVEGLTEFLPVSSTAHLLIAERLLGLEGARWEAFTIVIQFGAILAVVAVYWRKFVDVIRACRAMRRRAISRYVRPHRAFLPAAVIGVVAIKFINAVLLKPSTLVMPVIGATLMGGGIIILIFERLSPVPRYRDGDRLPLSKALQIGFCQVLAIVPGVSRSGATILGGELLGVDRKAAALFTFYLAVPTMFGASVFELYKKWHELSASDAPSIALGFAVSFAVAYFVVRQFIDFIGRYGLKPFGWYRIAAGAAIFAALALR